MRQVEQFQKGRRQRLLRPRRAVGDRKRNAPTGRRGAEHGRDVRRVGLDVRRHHHAVARCQVRVRLEQSEQAVMQYLHLAQRAVADVDFERAIILGQGLCGRRLQKQDVALHAPQQAGGAGILVILGFQRLTVEQLAGKLASRLTPGGQQRMTVGPFIHRLRRLGRPLRPLAASPRRHARRLQLVPVGSAGVQKMHVHGHVPGQRLQQLQIGRRQRRQAEHRQARRQAVHGKPPAAHALRQIDQQPALMRPPGRHLPPQPGVPTGIRARLPGRQPVRPEHLIALVTVGQAVGQLPGLQAIVGGQVALDFGRSVRAGEGRQQPEQQRPLLGRRRRRQVRILRAQHPPHEGGREHAIQIRRHAQALRHRQRQPARHAGVGHQDGFRRQRRAQRRGNHLAQPVGEALQAVAAVDVEHSGRAKVLRG